MKTGIFIAIFVLVAIGFTSTSFAVNPVATQLEQHDADTRQTLSRLMETGKLNMIILKAK